MYLKNHFIWLEKNFDKQHDLLAINELPVKNNAVKSLASAIKEKLELSKKQEENLDNIINEKLFANITDLYQITRKRDGYPTAKNFALLQNVSVYSFNSYLKNKQAIEKFWILFYPYFKKAYLNNEIDCTIFKNYDYQNYLFFSYQHFGLLHPDEFINEDGNEIPVKDIYFYSAVKKEFGWE